jgi:hypothetical protein
VEALVDIIAPFNPSIYLPSKAHHERIGEKIMATFADLPKQSEPPNEVLRMPFPNLAEKGT